MTEKIKFWQNKDFEVKFFATDPRDPEATEYQPIHGLHEVTPYGMMLFSLTGCTAQVILSYALHHGIDLEAVEFEASYERDYEEDCQNCETIDRYDEIILETIRLEGDLMPQEEQKLTQIAHQCPIHKMFTAGIPVEATLKTK